MGKRFENKGRFNIILEVKKIKQNYFLCQTDVII